MFLFIIGIIAAVVMLAAIGIAIAGEGDTRSGGGVVAVIAAIASFLFIFFSMATTVGTQDIGIVTSYGKVTGHLAPGFHMVAPWASVTSMDGAIQTETHDGQFTTTGQCSDPITTVRIARQQTACANVTIKWQINPAEADGLFRNYRTFAQVGNSLVTRELQIALNQQLAGYDPITSLTSAIPEGQPGNPSLNQLAEKVQAQMQADLHGQIRVLSVLLPPMAYDPSVQQRINKVLAQTALTDVAVQAEKTALAQAAANKALASSVSNDPGVLVSRCLDLVAEAIQAGYHLPPGFSCFGSSSVGIIAGK